MSTYPSRRRAYLVRGAAVTAALGLTLSAGAGLASAHVTANVYGDQPEQGGFGAVSLRVPNEEQQAGTTEIEVTVPAEYEISTVRAKPVPGWDAEVRKNDQGIVETVTWTASDGNEIPAGLDSYQEFDLVLGGLPETDSILLPTKQTYSDGTVSNWSEEQHGAEEPDHPAPVVELAPASGGGHGHSHGGGESDAAGGDHHEAAADATDDTARWLGGAGLLVGALGVGVGAGATLRARKIGKADS
ncbi:nuclear export factor GLE1 [Saccharomonospora sp. CUA-673]|uniref:YcnI family copper-binding membrane protein n=1 Tax=Saccharomonospora sp. CUA-673 TaxID=1904969 RepID=UPI00095EA50A|nr:YcnI family protein [Saccharomonospora sp. CUA-673]OLT40588.1 nuclear export factor GLE1 [Saccharomonospora sp. CUA-673]